MEKEEQKEMERNGQRKLVDGVGRGTREREMDRRWRREGREKEIERQTM